MIALPMPFSPKELIARVRALIRRSTGQSTNGLLKTEPLTLDPARHMLSCQGESLSLGPTEYRLLCFLSHADRVYSRSQLLGFVWTADSLTVDMSILRLRKALQPCGCEKLVQTVRDSGYRFSVSH